VDHAECQFVVMKLAVDRIMADVLQRVVHPTHVPFETEAETADVNRARHSGPGGGFLSNRLDVAMVFIDFEIEPPKELDGVEILAASKFIRNPLAFIPRVIEIQH